MAVKAGLKVMETKEPSLLLDGKFLFLGEVPKRSDFKKGILSWPTVWRTMSRKWDAIEDDTSIVMNIKDKGLVIISGCAHSGIVNTVRYAMAITGIDKVHAVMGGFHLSGPFFEPIIDRTTEELKKLNPAYIIPTHCTGRKAIMVMEKSNAGSIYFEYGGNKTYLCLT